MTTVQIVYFMICVLEDAIRHKKIAGGNRREWLRHIKDLIFTSLFFPCTLMRITRHRYSKRSLGLAALAAFITIYDVTYFTTYITHGAWLYPLTKVLSWFYRAVFIVVSTISIFGFYILGEYVAEKLVGLNLRRINEKLHST
ncbi:hypothetical protein C0J52_04988 [Blattella germanica]|nr:hypothetical protein C0J52_04988 [Blattella germanica]